MGEWWNPFDDNNALNPSKWVDAVSKGTGAVKDFVSQTWKSESQQLIRQTATVPPEFYTTETIKNPIPEAVKTAAAGYAGPPAQVLAKGVMGAYTGLKGTLRVAGAAYITPLQIVNNAVAFAANQYLKSPALAPAPLAQGITTSPSVLEPNNFQPSNEPVLTQLHSIVTNTDLGEMVIRQMPGGAAPDTGSGYFYGGQARADIEARKRELYPSIYGHTFTPGRFGAGLLAEAGVIQEGSVAWNAISGVADFAWTIWADPMQKLPEGLRLGSGEYSIPISRGTRAGREAMVTTGLSRESAQIVAKAVETGNVVLDAEGNLAKVANEMGVLQDARYTVAPNNWEAFKFTRRGRKVLDKLVEADSADGIWRASNRKIPPVIAHQLANATTKEEVIRILDDAVYSLDPAKHVTQLPGLSPEPVVTKVGATIKHNVQGRGWFLTEAVPESTRFPFANNPSQAAKNADDILGFIKMPAEDRVVNVAGENITIVGRKRLMENLFKALDPQSDTSVVDWLGEYEKSIAHHLLYDEGFTPKEIDGLTSWRQRLTSDIKALYSADELGRPVQMSWIDGEYGHGPLMNSQLLNIDPTLIDPVALQDFGRRVGLVRRTIRGLRWTADNRFIDSAEGLITDGANPLSANARYLFGAGANAVVHGAEHLNAFIRQAQNTAWKFNVLVKARWLAKAVPEETGRLWASGILGDHPVQALYNAPYINVDVFGDTVETARSVQRLWNEVDAAEANLTRASSVRSLVSREVDKAAKKILGGATLDEATAIVPHMIDEQQFRQVVEAAKKLREGKLTMAEYGQFFGDTITYYKTGPVGAAKRAMRFDGVPLSQIETELKNEIALKRNSIDMYEQRLRDGLPTADEALAGGMHGFLSKMLRGDDAGESMRQQLLRRGYVAKIDKTVLRDAPQYAQALSQRIGEMAANPEMRVIARTVLDATNPENATVLTKEEIINSLVDYFHGGPGNKMRLRYMRGVGQKVENWDTRQVTEDWVNALYNHFQVHTFGQEALMEAVATGKWMGMPISEHTPGSGRFRVGGPDPKANAQFVKEVRDVYMQDPAAPNQVIFFPTIYDGELFPKQVSEMKKGLDKLNELMWSVTYGKLTDKFARAPMWNYAYWRATAEALPNATPKVAQEVLKVVDGLDLPELLKDDLHLAASVANGSATRSALNDYAYSRANQIAKDTFSFKKSRYGSVHSVSAPFFDAFRELSKMLFINASNPKYIHKVDQALAGAKANTFLGPGDINGDGVKEGFLYRDPDTGKEMLNFPMPGFLAQVFFGDMKQSIGASIPAASMSIVTQMYPGVGPVVQYALNGVLPTSSEFDALREYINPAGPPNLNDAIAQWIPFFGERNIQRASQALAEMLPKNGNPAQQLAKNVFTILGGLSGGIENQKQYAQTLNKALVAVWASKDWNPDVAGIQQPLGQEQIDQWVSESRNLATKLWLLTAGSWATTGNISPEFYVATKNGPVMFGALKDHWNKFRQDPQFKDMSYGDQLETFVELYGNDGIVALLQPITDKPIQGSTATKEWQNWYEQNKTVVEANPSVSGYFGPQAAEFDDGVWGIQTAIFGIKYKKPEDLVRNIQSAQANFLYNRAMRRFKEDNGLTPQILNASPQARDALSQFKFETKQFLLQQIPGWDQALSAEISNVQTRTQFAQIKRIVADPSMSSNKAVVATKQYLDFREAAIAEMGRYLKTGQTVTDVYGMTRQTKTMLGLNQALFDKGEALSAQYPEFGPLWNAVLSKEVRRAVEEQG